MPELTPDCPVCGKPMVLKTASTGWNAGGQFYGCSDFPECEGLVNLDKNGEHPGPATAGSTQGALLSPWLTPRIILAPAFNTSHQAAFFSIVIIA